jgi:hypothetical protein
VRFLFQKPDLSQLQIVYLCRMVSLPNTQNYASSIVHVEKHITEIYMYTRSVFAEILWSEPHSRNKGHRRRAGATIYIEAM